jgi:predicted Na+-dependent transporter
LPSGARQVSRVKRLTVLHFGRVPQFSGRLLLLLPLQRVAGGTTSNLFSYFSRGDVSLSITMTVISSILSFGTLPLMLFLWGQPFTTDSIQIPYTNILLSLLLVIVPVAIGMTIRTYRPAIAHYLEKFATVLGVIFIVVAIIFGSVTEADIFLAPAGEYVSCFIMVLGGALAGYGLSIAAGLRRYQARTVAIETGIQNSTLTIAIMTFTFGSDAALLPKALRFPLLYSVVIIVSGVIQTGIFYWSSQSDSEADIQHRLLAEAAERDATEAEEKAHSFPASATAGKDGDGAALNKGGSIQMADSTGSKLSAGEDSGVAV